MRATLREPFPSFGKIIVGWLNFQRLLLKLSLSKSFVVPESKKSPKYAPD
jgi:hypothetical protein